ncbi:CST complex subunit TEN1 [Tanacetum coccineum]
MLEEGDITDGGWRRMETAAATETMGILKARVGRNVDGMDLNLYEQSLKLILFVLHPPMMVCVMIDIPFRVDSVSKKDVMLYACLSPSHIWEFRKFSDRPDEVDYDVKFRWKIECGCRCSYFGGTENGCGEWLYLEDELEEGGEVKG